jgi:hypothetical protein
MSRQQEIDLAIYSAIYVTCSPHEWEWTHDQQVAMARYCVEASKLIDSALRMLEEIVCTVPPDDGVILLSGDSPSEWDESIGCHVYKHEHFSPLGDALISLHQHLSQLTKGGADGVQDV